MHALIRLVAFSVVAVSFMIATVVTLSRGQASPLQIRLDNCESRCIWDTLDVQGLSAGDIITGLGVPSQVIFSDTGWRPGLPTIAPYFAESLYYPSRKLVVTIDNYENPKHIWPHTSQRISMHTMTQTPIVTLNWRGFASLCYYLPHLIDQCASY